MASSQSQQPVNNTTPSGLVKPTGDNIDEAWQWNSLKDINNRRSVTCDFCNKVTNGGITRARNHQMGVKGNVGACKKIPQDIKLKIKETYEKKKAESNAHLFEVNEDDDEQDEVQEIFNIRAGKGPTSVAAPAAKKGKSTKGPLDLHYARAPPPGATSNSKQRSIHDKEARSRTIQYIAQWFYKCGIPFNALRDKTFKLMIDAVGNYGPNLDPPSYWGDVANVVGVGEAERLTRHQQRMRSQAAPREEEEDGEQIAHDNEEELEEHGDEDDEEQTLSDTI